MAALLNRIIYCFFPGGFSLLFISYCILWSKCVVIRSNVDFFFSWVVLAVFDVSL